MYTPALLDPHKGPTAACLQDRLHTKAAQYLHVAELLHGALVLQQLAAQPSQLLVLGFQLLQQLVHVGPPPQRINLRVQAT